MSIHTDKFEFCTKENEEIDAIIKVYEEKNSVLCGLVVDCKNKPVENAVVKLLEKNTTPHGIKLIPLTHTFTDSCGQFLFGPLCPNKKYVLKVWYNNVSIRKIHFDNSDCNEDCSCIKSENNTNYPTCNCDDSFITHHSECSSKHESHNHNCESNCNHDSYSHLEEFKKNLQSICNSNDKDDVDDLDLPIKKSKERRHHHKEDSSD